MFHKNLILHTIIFSHIKHAKISSSKNKSTAKWKIRFLPQEISHFRMISSLLFILVARLSSLRCIHINHYETHETENISISCMSVFGYFKCIWLFFWCEKFFSCICYAFLCNCNCALELEELFLIFHNLSHFCLVPRACMGWCDGCCWNNQNYSLKWNLWRLFW